MVEWVIKSDKDFFVAEILRVDDYTVRLTEPRESEDSYILRYSDFVDVKCESKIGNQ